MNEENFVNDENGAYEKFIMIAMIKIMLFIDEGYENYNITGYTEFGETKTNHTSYEWWKKLKMVVSEN